MGTIPSRVWVPVILVGLVAAVVLARPDTGEAVSDYASETGQSCGTCHTNPAGGGQLTAQGEAFKAIQNHSSDPAAAWAQVSGAASPTATPTATPVPTPADSSTPTPVPTPTESSTSTLVADSPVSVELSYTSDEDAVVYSLLVRNSGSEEISNLYVAGSVPQKATFIEPVNGPEGSSFLGSTTGLAAWTIGSVPAGGSAGPFQYRVSKRGKGGPRSAVAFVYWSGPSQGAAISTRAVKTHEASEDQEDEDEESQEEDAVSEEVEEADSTSGAASEEGGPRKPKPDHKPKKTRGGKEG